MIYRVTCILLAGSLLVQCGCGASKPRPIDRPAGDRSFTQYVSSARSSLLDYGDADQAATLYAKALDRAYTINQPELIALASYGQAAALARLRRYDQALTALAVSGVELPESSKPRRALLEARIHLERGDAAAADRMLLEPIPNGTTGVLWRLSQAEVALEQGDLQRAKVIANQTAPIDSPAYRQHASRLNGRIAIKEGDYLEAAQAFGMEADHARSARNWPAAAEATSHAAKAYALAGEPARAAAFYLQAGRSAKLQPEAVLPADDWLMAAVQHAEQADQPEIAEAAEQMLQP